MPYLSAPSSGWSPKHGQPGWSGITLPEPSSDAEPSSVTLSARIVQSLGLVVGVELFDTAISTSERPLTKFPSGVNGSCRIVMKNRLTSGS